MKGEVWRVTIIVETVQVPQPPVVVFKTIMHDHLHPPQLFLPIVEA